MKVVVLGNGKNQVSDEPDEFCTEYRYLFLKMLIVHQPDKSAANI